MNDACALTIETAHDGQLYTLTLGGDLDFLTAAQFLERMTRVIDDRTERLVLDLAGLTFLDCGGARALAKATYLAPTGCPVIIRSLSPAAHRVLDLLDLKLGDPPQEPGEALEQHVTPMRQAQSIRLTALSEHARADADRVPDSGCWPGMPRDVGKSGEHRPALAPGEGERTAEQWERALDARQRAAERRDADADERERLADLRDARADERDRLADLRDGRADERDRLADLRDRALLRDSAVARLQARLATMPVIEQAKGVIMEQEGCTAEQAFDLLRKASQHSNVPVRELAVLIMARSSRRSWTCNLPVSEA